MAGDVNYYGKKSKNGMYFLFYLIFFVEQSGSNGACIYKIKKNMFSSGFEPETFRVLGGCDNQLHHENAYRDLLCLDNLFHYLYLQ